MLLILFLSVVGNQSPDPLSEATMPAKVQRHQSSPSRKTSPLTGIRRSARNKPGISYIHVSDS